MIRVGQGVDVHPFDKTRPLVLGGVTIPDSPGLSGHSDADVLSHAVADALLGSTNLGDLGKRFPADERWREASSLAILRETSRLIAEAGWSCINIDSTIVAERPRLAAHVAQMQQNVAEALGIGPEVVSVKATTTDGLGFTGRGAGIAALAVVLVQR
jgi:2-C-methyl-D-erythritol 2,4-cyclodiphosphate synthase